MLVNFVNIWIHAIRAQDQDAKMEASVKLTTHLLCHRSDADVPLVSRLHCAKSQNATHAIRDHAKTVAHANWKHSKITCAIALRDILVRRKSIGKISSELNTNIPFYLLGKYCEKQNLCASSPCANSGTCISLPGGDFKCHCPKGFQGKTCSEDVEECNTMPCQHGGTCRNTLGSYQ